MREIMSGKKYRHFKNKKYLGLYGEQEYTESQDSLEPVADFIYKIWFPQSTCRLNESVKYDFAKYGEEVDEEGKSQIEYWVPIL